MFYRAAKAVPWGCEVFSWVIGQKTRGGIALLHICQANRYITEMTQKLPMLTFSNGLHAPQKKGVAEPSPLSFFAFIYNRSHFELKPVSVQFPQVTTDCVVMLCAHGHRYYFPAFAQI